MNGHQLKSMRCSRLAAALDTGKIKYNGKPLNTAKKAHFDALVDYWVSKEGITIQTARDDVLLVLGRLKQMQYAAQVREKANRVYPNIQTDDADIPDEAVQLIRGDPNDAHL